MLTLKLKRKYFPEHTEGTIEIGNKTLSTLERPWLDNQANISCIPEGIYKVVRDSYGRHRWFSVPNVPSRSYIEIHEGYTTKHSQGCILLDIIELQDLMLYVEGEEFLLEITSGD